VAPAVSPTVEAHEPFVTEPEAAFAVGALINESVETAKTRGKKEETKRRNLRMKTARFTAISEVFLLWSRRKMTRFCPVIA
jgi:hypothetical protein